MRCHCIPSCVATIVAATTISLWGALVQPAVAQTDRAEPFSGIDLKALRKNGASQPVPAPSASQRGETFSANRTDPIGSIKRASVFDRAQRIFVGRGKAGAVCYFRESGDTHQLDIGVSKLGAFVRLETPETGDVIPPPPVRVFAGREKTRRSGGNEYATGEFTVLKPYDGDVEFYALRRGTGDFMAIARSNAESDVKAFLEMVAGARGQFVVVQSKANPKATSIVAVYRFRAAAIPALLACAKSRLK